jgi:thiol-disulfide isomerase/thioredoxin
MLSGCGALDKKQPKTASTPAPAPVPPAATAERTPAPTTPVVGVSNPRTADADTPPPNVGGLLAGQVLDGSSRPPAKTLIQVIAAAEGQSAPAAPIEVEANAQGYFTIPGLQAGRAYQLVARANQNGRLLVGQTWARPPRANLLIVVSEDYAPAAPTQGRPAPAPVTQPAPSGVQMGAPVGDKSPATTGSPLPPEAEGIANRDPLAQAWPPKAVVPPGPGSTPQNSQPTGDRSVTPAPVITPTGQGPIPWCVLTGKKLEDFALYDLDDKPWQFSKNRDARTRLVLLDFWATDCRYCLEGIPFLIKLKNVYGDFGLDVVGIAHERGTLDTQKNNVRQVRLRYNVNYPLLLGGDPSTCPVKNQFRVGPIPSLFLLDANGNILWHSEGLDGEKKKELVNLIYQQLSLK